MNLIILFEKDFVDNGMERVCLQGRRLRHVLEVHRAKVGDELRVGLLGGLLGAGRVTFLNDGILEMEVNLNLRPPEALPATLILSLPRPKVLKRVVSCASSLGVKRIILMNSYRVGKSFWQSPALKEDNLIKYLISGLEQARDTILPEVWIRPLFKPFVEDELPELIKETLSIVAHPEAPAPCPRNVGHQVTVAIGPEGGFVPYEVEKLISCGFSAVRLGERVLRVETAIPFLLSKLF
jgi:16S rRNA (uracil1498-N3)-methyltransferase